jgi:hypothetical protein
MQGAGFGTRRRVASRRRRAVGPRASSTRPGKPEHAPAASVRHTTVAEASRVTSLRKSANWSASLAATLVSLRAKGGPGGQERREWRHGGAEAGPERARARRGEARGAASRAGLRKLFAAPQ